MSFEPTHRLRSKIGRLNAGTPVRAGRLQDFDMAEDLLAYLGDREYLSYRWWDEDVLTLSDDRGAPLMYLELTDYLITDGNKFESAVNLKSLEPVSSDTKVQITVVTILGDVHRSQWFSVDDYDLSQLKDITKKVKKLDALHLELPNGQTIYFNTDHVVSVTIQEDADV